METKDIQYFLDAEKNFSKEHPDYGNYKFDEVSTPVRDKK